MRKNGMARETIMKTSMRKRSGLMSQLSLLLAMLVLSLTEAHSAPLKPGAEWQEEANCAGVSAWLDPLLNTASNIVHLAVESIYFFMSLVGGLVSWIQILIHWIVAAL